MHPHTKHLHLSNIKVVTQSNTIQKSKFKLGSLVTVVSIVGIRVLRNVLLISFTVETSLVLHYYIRSFLNFQKNDVLHETTPVQVPGSHPTRPLRGEGEIAAATLNFLTFDDFIPNPATKLHLGIGFF